MINFTPRFIKKNVEKIIYETAFDYMTSKVITFKADQGIIEVIETITKRKISGAPVINNNGEIIGIITEKDCLRLIYDEKYHNLPPNKGNVINYMSKKVVTLGEIMLRLYTPDFKRFAQADSFDITYGGGEANVAAALCNYGLNGTFVTKVPNNPIGQAAINHLRRYGVDTQFIARGGERLGIYFLETGASMRASQVIYDRAGASIADVDASEFDFDKIFEGADWFVPISSLGEKDQRIRLLLSGKCLYPHWMISMDSNQVPSLNRRQHRFATFLVRAKKIQYGFD